MILSNSSSLRLLLVPGGGGSGPNHWDRWWEAEDERVERVIQADWYDGTVAEWIKTIDRHIQASSKPTVLIAHSLGNIATCHWARTYAGPVVGAFLVAPADVHGGWVAPGSLYERFRPCPMKRLPFPSMLVASSNDPYLSPQRAKALAKAWGAMLETVGPHGHIGSDSSLGSWKEGRRLLGEFVQSINPDMA